MFAQFQWYWKAHNSAVVIPLIPTCDISIKAGVVLVGNTAWNWYPLVGCCGNADQIVSNKRVDKMHFLHTKVLSKVSFLRLQKIYVLLPIPYISNIKNLLMLTFVFSATQIQKWRFIDNNLTEKCSGQVVFAGPILTFPMCDPGLKVGPPHITHGVG